MTELVPGYVSDLNRIARHIGLEVTESIIAVEGEYFAQSVWCGSIAQFTATELFYPSAVFPRNTGRIHCSRYLDGTLAHVGRGVYVLDQRDRLPSRRQLVAEEVELLDFGEEDAGSTYYGPRSAIIAAGVASAKQIPQRIENRYTNRARIGWNSEDEIVDWKVILYPNDKVLVWRQSRAAMLKRIAEVRQRREQSEAVDRRGA